jgi:collagenase-like PrtC family protease
MKILSPVSKADEAETLISAGAEELYCGLLPSNWPFPAFSINRRQEPEANFHSFDALKKCIDIAHARGVPLFLTLNEHSYTDKQYPYILDYVKRALDAGVDAFLIADIALLLTFRECNIVAPVHMSTGATTFNSACARFYQSLGAERIILPRHLTVDEIRRIVKGVPDLEFEVFILNSKCHNVDGFCTFHHGLTEVADKGDAKKYRNACMIHYNIHLSSPMYSDEEMMRIAPQIPRERQHMWERVHIDTRPCGACAIYDFHQMGIHSVKIVGRKNSTKKKQFDIHFIKNCFDFLTNQKPSREEYRERTQSLYQETYKYSCRYYMCYYPSLNPSWNTQYLPLKLST